jgi:hypothetical protein
VIVVERDGAVSGRRITDRVGRVAMSRCILGLVVMVRMPVYVLIFGVAPMLVCMRVKHHAERVLSRMRRACREQADHQPRGHCAENGRTTDHRRCEE